MSDQNGNDEINPIHADFISSAPEELRDAAQQLAPVWDQYVQGKFQEAADFRKKYEPYQELPLDQVTAEGIQDYLNFLEISNDPQKLYEWHQQWDQAIRENHPDLFNGNQNELNEYTNDPELVRQVNELAQWRKDQESSAASQQAEMFVKGQLDEIKGEHPYLSDQDMDDICALAAKYVPDNPTNGQMPDDFIQRGFKDFQQIVGRTERDLFNKKEQHQHSPANHGGRPSVGVKAITTLEEANEAARRAIIEAMKT